MTSQAHYTDKEFHKKFSNQACEWAEEEDITDAFPRFVMKIIFTKLNKDEIENALEKLGSNDIGMDAFWVDEVDKIIHIAQFKSSTNCNNIRNITKSEISYFNDVDERLQNPEYIKKCNNKRVQDIADEYAKYRIRGYKILKHFVCLNYIGRDSIEHYSSIDFYDVSRIKDIWDMYNSAISTTDPKTCEIIIDYTNPPQLIEYSPSKRYKTAIILITGLELVRLRKKHHYNLFARNVRYFLGETNTVNREIIATATNDHYTEFYYYNNGITISCSQYQKKPANNAVKLILNCPQIINGAQTVNSLNAAYDKKILEISKKEPDDEKVIKLADDHFKKILVLCRIIESTKGDDNESKFARNLTTYNNSQNPIKPTDFYSNRPEQKELQEKLSSYSFFYEIKRGEREYLKKNKTEKFCDKKLTDYKEVRIDIAYLVALYQSYKGKPYDAGDKKFFDDDEEYKKLFGDKKSDINTEKIKDIILAINIFNAIEVYSKSYRKISREINILSREPHNEMSINKLNKYLSEDDSDFLLDKLRDSLKYCKNYSDETQSEILRFRKYKLLSNGKYFIIALISNILAEFEYKELLLKDKFQDSEFIRSSLVKKWLLPILSCMQKIYEINQNKKSETAFFKDPYAFDEIKKIINDTKYDENPLFRLD